MAKDFPPPQAVASTNGETVGVEPAATPRFSPKCPINGDHPGAKVYRTDLRTRYCKCNTCGHLWKMAGPPASPTAEFLDESATTLEESCSEPQQIEGQACIIIPVKSARLLAKKMRAHSRELQLGLSNTD
jgi:hypothetical protein